MIIHLWLTLATLQVAARAAGFWLAALDLVHRM
jgi:hypothetical protein